MHIRGIATQRLCSPLKPDAPNNAQPLAERPLKSYGRVNEDVFPRKREWKKERESRRCGAVVEAKRGGSASHKNNAVNAVKRPI